MYSADRQMLFNYELDLTSMAGLCYPWHTFVLEKLSLVYLCFDVGFVHWTLIILSFLA